MPFLPLQFFPIKPSQDCGETLNDNSISTQLQLGAPWVAAPGVVPCSSQHAALPQQPLTLPSGAPLLHR